LAGRIIGLPQNNRNNQFLAPTLQQHPSIHGLTVNNRNNHVPIPTENPFLGETLAAVDPSEVRTLSKTQMFPKHISIPLITFPDVIGDDDLLSGEDISLVYKTGHLV